MASPAFRDRVIWITGASTGIGRSCAEEFVRRGAKVALSARSEDKLKELAEDLGSERALALPLDVTDLEANRQAVTKIEEHFGALDMPFLNAGTWQAMDLKDFSAELFAKHMRINVEGMANGIEAALPALYRSKRPLLVGMSSSVAYRGMPRAEAYCASKAAIRSMLQGLRVQLVDRGVPVTVICPGFVKSPLTDQNDFAMPFIMEPEDAARIIANGIAKEKSEIDFPKRFTWMLKAMSLLPDGIYTKLAHRMVLGS